jgi:hypothetical protein
MKVATALVGGALLWSGVAYAADNGQTAGQFLQQCHVNRTACMEYIRGALDGIVWTQELDHERQFCFSDAQSYLEIIDGYVDYLTVMVAKPDPQENPILRVGYRKTTCSSWRTSLAPSTVALARLIEGEQARAAGGAAI